MSSGSIPLAAACCLFVALLACGGGVEHQRHDTGHGVTFELPKTCTPASPGQFQCAGGLDAGGSSVSFEPFALGIDVVERDPLMGGGKGASKWSGRVKAGELDAIEVGIRQTVPDVRHRWLAAVAGPKGTVLIQLSAKEHGSDQEPKRDNILWRRLLASVKAQP